MAEGVRGFGDRLSEKIASASPLCVGIDPSSALLSAWGLGDDVRGLEQMARTAVHAAADVAAAIKPQVAFFERHGSRGIGVLESVITDAREAGLLVVADAKRGDIDSTMTAYGEAWLADGSPLCVDALTVTAYLGIDAMAPVFELCRSTGRGLFAVVASSNPEGRGLQRATMADGRSVEETLLAALGAANARDRAEDSTCGPFGAVVGATREAGALDLASLGGPFLVPGVGAQGATPNDVAALFSGCAPKTVLVNASRSILAQGPDASSVAAAAASLASELATSLG
jgi:orotidine-5'-phosphate decarboxylase